MQPTIAAVGTATAADRTLRGQDMPGLYEKARQSISAHGFRTTALSGGLVLIWVARLGNSGRLQLGVPIY